MIHVKPILRALFPNLYKQLYIAHKHYTQSKQILAEAQSLKALTLTQGFEAYLSAILNSETFHTAQKREEIAQLLQRVQRLQLRILCEIGCYRGGTLSLFSCVVARKSRFISIDLNHNPRYFRAYHHFWSNQGRLDLINGNSYASRTVERVKHLLRGNAIDFLFIDGDHSYEGVSADFQAYAPLVRTGGLIGFHDILPDYRTRYGKVTSADSGEVYKFWEEIKRRFQFEEYIQDQH